MATHKIDVTARLASATLAAAALLAAPSSAATQECVGWVIDAGVAWASSSGALSGDRMVLARSRGSTPPLVAIHRYDPTRDKFVFQAALDNPGWNAAWFLRHIAMDGDLLAFQPDRPGTSSEVCVIGERAAGGWTTQTVPLISEPMLTYGQLTAVCGDRVVTLTGEWNSRFILHIIERSPAGDFFVADRIVAQGVRPVWFEDAVSLVLDGDIAAFTMDRITPSGTIVVFERDASGTWLQTNIPPPADASFRIMPGQALAIDGDRLAINMRQWPLQSQYFTLIYRRTGPGTWVVEQRIVTEDPALSWSSLSGSVGLGDGRLAIQHWNVTRQFEQNAQGRFTPVRSYELWGKILALDSSRIAWGAGNRILIAPTTPETPVRNRICPDFGYTICDQGDPSDPWLSLDRGEPMADSTAKISNGAPGSLCRLYVAADPGRRPIGTGTLCLDSASALPLGALAQLDPSGNASIVMPTASLPSTGLGLVHVYVQAVVMDPAPRLTNAVRFVHF